ncbi:MAG TPA: FGGY-family carbohydrate kinase [Chthonomonas sp.]|uniref:FGGY-family carbohydrate kinase n=1 Tax=Chthonomonas sp. TaxID=2282153 RepID=UPI002B4B0A0C|nr:FGGY-family carbohydrate kinase [Chthonomonas sp.]HLI49711.1 FGGY-family carbohydrate kinase [Chthonomonas sp.]
MSDYVIGVDVGTGSARAGLFDLRGKLLAMAVEPIQIWRPHPHHVEQSSEDIWRAVSTVVRACCQRAECRPEAVRGISFDATCSLVVLGDQDQPLPVNFEGDANRNIIVWMDHRALAEAEEINAGHYEVLRYVGWKISPEMETPKLLWLKRNLPETWQKARRFFDLADYLTYRATGNDTRSFCTVVCKWTYLGHVGENGTWDHNYFKAIGLEDVLERGLAGHIVRPMGSPLGKLSPQAATDLGLTTECSVGVGIIDAHAGGIGLLGAVWDEDEPLNPARLDTALAYIGGTSGCHMAVSQEPRFLQGVWGPYYSAMIPGMWLIEAGQSSAGSAIDQAVLDHANAPSLQAEATERSCTPHEILNSYLEHQATQSQESHWALLTRDIHVLPFYLGNRSPYADPHARAVLDGLTLDNSINSQALRYLATIQGVCSVDYLVIQALNNAGFNIQTLFVTGGITKNPLWLQTLADATGLPCVLPAEEEAVLLGTAILAAVGSQAYPDVLTAMRAMCHRGRVVQPNLSLKPYYEARHRIIENLYQQQLAHRNMMKPFETR